MVPSAANLISNYILKLHPLFSPIIRALHHLFSPSWDSPTLSIIRPRFQTHESGKCIPAPLSPPLTLSPTFKVVRYSAKDWPLSQMTLGSNPGSAVTCCMASPVVTLPRPLCSPLCQVLRVGEHDRFLQASLPFHIYLCPEHSQAPGPPTLVLVCPDPHKSEDSLQSGSVPSTCHITDLPTLHVRQPRPSAVSSISV